MAAPVSGNLLKATKAIIWVILVALGIAAAALLLAAVVLPFKWDEALAALAREEPGVNAEGLLPALYLLFAVGLIIIALAWAIMRRLLAIIATVSKGDPFMRDNAQRLKTIGWLMVAAYVAGFPLAVVATGIAERFGDHDIGADGFSITGILGILLTFVLAGVFEQGAAMREEMEGTV